MVSHFSIVYRVCHIHPSAIRAGSARPARIAVVLVLARPQLGVIRFGRLDNKWFRAVKGDLADWTSYWRWSIANEWSDSSSDRKNGKVTRSI
jgi:hypothetical protein